MWLEAHHGVCLLFPAVLGWSLRLLEEAAVAFVVDLDLLLTTSYAILIVFIISDVRALAYLFVLFRLYGASSIAAPLISRHLMS